MTPTSGRGGHAGRPVVRVADRPVLAEGTLHADEVGDSPPDVPVDVTERQEAQRALELSQRQLAQAQAIAHLGSVEFDARTGTITRSDEYYRVLGVSRGVEPAGGLFPSVLDPSDRASWERAWAGAIDDGVPFDLMYRIVRSDREARWVRVRGEPQVGPDGAVTNVVGTVMDETERVEAEHALRRSERLVLAFLETMPIGVCVVAADGSPFFANRAATDMLGTGIAPGDPAGLPSDYDLFHAGSDARYPAGDQPIEQALHGLDVHSDETEVHRGGQAVPVEVWAGPVRDEAGSITHAIAVFADISLRRQTDRRLRFQAHLLDTAGQAIIATDLTGTITYWNATAEQLYGWPAAEALGRAVTEVLPSQVTGPQADEILDAVAHGTSWSGDLEVRRRDGTTFRAAITNTPVFDDSATVIGVIGVSTDVTEQRALEDRVNQGQRLESLGQLAGGIAHDFNNLLSVMMMHGKFVADATDGQIREDALQITAAARSAARLTRQLLTFARREPVAFHALDLNAVVDDIHGLLDRTLGAHVQLVVRASAVPLIAADRGQTEQILLNLAVNARDAMPDGGTLTIETSVAELDDDHLHLHPVAPAGTYVLLSVSDTGTGMAADVAARAFEPFFTTKTNDAGTGLGLATIYGIVAAAGGTLDLSSEVGVGTTMCVYLPVSDDATAEEPARRPVGEVTGHGERVLVVEDNQAVRALTLRVLRRNGYVAVEALNPLEALATARSGGVDLLLVDVVMPEMSGPTLAASVHVTHPQQKVLYMSGYGEGVIGPTGGLGLDTALIQKPFTETELVAAVDAALTDDRRHPVDATR